MKDLLQRIDRRIRLNDGFARLAPLRAILRRPYHWTLNRFGGGTRLVVGGHLPVRVPAEFGSKEAEQYEIEAVEAIAHWARSASAKLFVDIGCSLGYLSAGVRANAPTVHVVAIDADVHSLATTRRICTFAGSGGERLLLLNAFVGASDAGESDHRKLAENSLRRLSAAGVTGRPGSTYYVNLDEREAYPDLPTITLDSLLQSLPIRAKGEACLVKCDIEGAEGAMLSGATETLTTLRPHFLLSVHPPYLPRFGTSRAAIEEALLSHDYRIRCLSVDHEEHWLCVPREGVGSR